MFALGRIASVAATSSTRRAPAAIRSLSTLHPTLYTSTTTSTGSRAQGNVSTPEKNLDLTMGMPKEMGGSKGPAGGESNPEQLFGAAYSTCFLSALGATHGSLFPKHKPLPKSTTVRALVSIGKNKTEKVPGFLLAVELEVLKKPLQQVGLEDAEIHKLVQQAHQLCPYSRAVQGNIEVVVRVVDA
ncbi:BZ3500_MvSof-1268-A1-R1_Chr1-3g02108 [Microbotryum saponariae]|uniref:BZ3500_MvSof-1268-A1-R1_Chr1-3g02108 protein n=1 Tax=Microbotryum saponariae TaxID=289078 RepID=A0A2X0MFD7_9BASI|nr:BZ3500_MvSof-1268-A1-R1_Chr1-3g02108 [Microbotryum saponariae]SCZ95410.1 BZ3501_MvSof-1269-A2-R1_Chr1-3g01710 [Microbotryum saponariae]